MNVSSLKDIFGDLINFNKIFNKRKSNETQTSLVRVANFLLRTKHMNEQENDQITKKQTNVHLYILISA